MPFAPILYDFCFPQYKQKTFTSVVEVNLNLPPGGLFAQPIVPRQFFQLRLLFPRRLSSPGVRSSPAKQLIFWKSRFPTGGFGRPCIRIGVIEKKVLLTHWSSELVGRGVSGKVRLSRVTRVSARDCPACRLSSRRPRTQWVEIQVFPVGGAPSAARGALEATRG